MPESVREFRRPAACSEAAGWLQRAPVPAALLTRGPRIPDPPFGTAETVLDLGALDLTYVREAPEAVEIGALTPLQTVAEAAPVGGLASGVLRQSAQLSAGSALRHLASLGGTVLQQPEMAQGVRRQGPPEVVLALLALEAQLVFCRADGSQRLVRLDDYLATMGMAGMEGVLTQVRLPVPAADGGALARVGRTPRDQAIVAAVAVVDAAQGQIQRARVAVAGAGPRAQRLPALEALVTGQVPNEALWRRAEAAASAQADPASDYLASADYRRAMAGVLARRALAEAWRLAAG